MWDKIQTSNKLAKSSIMLTRAGGSKLALLADLKIKASKCEFFNSHVCYLGFLISESGIRCDRSKVEAINKITTPTSIKEVQQVCAHIIINLSHTTVT